MWAVLMERVLLSQVITALESGSTSESSPSPGSRAGRLPGLAAAVAALGEEGAKKLTRPMPMGGWVREFGPQWMDIRLTPFHHLLLSKVMLC
jgi:hypothetical protein